jgi:dTDP-L-rhamnose 4-epimerase
MTRYTDVNVGGTARLLEALRDAGAPVARIVLASTRAVYGEGAYRSRSGELVVPAMRRNDDLERGRFEPLGPDGAPLEPVATTEQCPPQPSSIYAATKLAQEHLLRLAAESTSWSPVVLRLQNVYGPGQSLQNPYTGVLSVFVTQILAEQRLRIFEDGEIARDFVYVDDVVAALAAAARAQLEPGSVINVGSGQPRRILDVARLLLRLLGRPEDRLDVTGEFRAGDIRFALADATRARELLGWQARVPLETGLAEFTAWAQAQRDPSAA